MHIPTPARLERWDAATLTQIRRNQSQAQAAADRLVEAFRTRKPMPKQKPPRREIAK